MTLLKYFLIAESANIEIKMKDNQVKEMQTQIGMSDGGEKIF